MSDYDALNEIIKQVDIEAFLNHMGLQKNQKGRWYVNCPFCGGKEKLSIDIATTLWSCFKDTCPSGEGGNLITLYAKLNNCSNGDAVKAMKEFAGIKDDFQPAKSQKKTRKTKVSPKTKDIPINSNPNSNEGDDIPSRDEESAPAEHRDSPDPKHVEFEIEENTDGPAVDTALSWNIYTELIKLAHLTDAHRNELRVKRGFNDDLIERLSFRSGGPYMAEIVETLKKKFSSEDLHASGVLFEINGRLVPNNLLTNLVVKNTKNGIETTHSNILIPYLDENEEVRYLRSHKYGFKGKPIEIYCRKILKTIAISGLNLVVITEGEFKAAALEQLNIPAIAVPGVGSFTNEHLEKLIATLKEFGIKKVVLLFDNEIKDNPEYGNYKQKPEDRYDTDFYAYIMAWKLGAAGFISQVGHLPDTWRQKGKIDCDSALAQGKTYDDFMTVINHAKLPSEFLSTLPEDAKRIVQRKNAKYFSEDRSPIKREHNKYVITLKDENGKIKRDDTLSNFIINIKSSFFTPDGVIRNVQLVNEFGEISATFSLASTNMAGLHEFKQYCFSKGNYLFKGNSDDLLRIWEFEFARDIGDIIYMPGGIGHVEPNIWLFANLAISKGKVYYPDNDGIMWINGKGYKPQSILINFRGESTEESIPAISEKPIDLVDLAKKIKQTVGGYEAYMGIGWLIATLFNDDIFNIYRCSPIFFPHGKRGSGKSTFARWLIRCAGIELEGAGLADTSPNYISRAVSFYCSLPVPLEEYRNEQRVKQKDGLLRGLYNRQFSGKGTNTSIYTSHFKVGANILIAGEELPSDNGLYTRLVPVQISEHCRDRTHYEYLNKHMSSFSYLTYYVLLHYEEIKPKLLANIADLKQALVTKDISDRTAENWAICAGAFYTVIAQDSDFILWVEKACQEIKQTGEKEHMLNQFFRGVAVLVNERKLNDSHIHAEINKNYVAIWTGVYDIWAQHYRMVTGHEPFDELSIRKYLMDEPYYIKTEKTTFLKNERKRAFIVKYDKAPEELQDAVDILNARKWDERPGNLASNDNG